MHFFMPIIFSFLSKRSLVRNSFFYKAPVLWNSLPQYIKLSSSFAAVKNRVTLFYHGKNRNIWHLQRVKSIRYLITLYVWPWSQPFKH